MGLRSRLVGYLVDTRSDAAVICACPRASGCYVPRRLACVFRYICVLGGLWIVRFFCRVYLPCVIPIRQLYPMRFPRYPGSPLLRHNQGRWKWIWVGSSVCNHC